MTGDPDQRRSKCFCRRDVDDVRVKVSENHARSTGTHREDR